MKETKAQEFFRRCYDAIDSLRLPLSLTDDNEEKSAAVAGYLNALSTHAVLIASVAYQRPMPTNEQLGNAAKAVSNLIMDMFSKENPVF